MYLPRHFEQDDHAAILALVAEVSLAELITFDGSQIESSAIPMLFEPSSHDGGESGVLVGHVARANRQWSSFDPEVEALAIFRGPDAYVSPAWYATKAENAKVVPTWNYATVHVRGRLVVHDDPQWLLALVTRLTTTHESKRDRPWSVADAPAEYIEHQLRAIVGVELEVRSIEAKWKLSQNQPVRNRVGVARGLSAGARASEIDVAVMIDTVGE